MTLHSGSESKLDFFDLLGSEYGRKGVYVSPSFSFDRVLSVGVGEDISWDIEMINKYDSKVLLLDPTPRAVAYYHGLIPNYGLKATTKYSSSGYQLYSAYDLRKVNNHNLRFIPKALWWHSRGRVFFPPPNPLFVSYSARNMYGTQETAIRFETISYRKLLKSTTEQFDVVKLDVEGSAFECLIGMWISKHKPRQLIIELEELVNNSLCTVVRIFLTGLLLRIMRYKCKLIIQENEFLFVRG